MIQNIFHRHRHPTDDLWVKCPSCHELIYRPELEHQLQTCPKCSHHSRLSASERIATLIDESSWNEEDATLVPGDPLEFVSAGQKYTEKIAESQEKTGLREAAIAGAATLERMPVRVVVCDFAFLGASMGSVVGEKVARAAERSVEDRRPLLLICASGGARMHEGIYSLMQMAKTAAAIARLHDAGVACVAVLTDPTTGGVTASFASLGDVTLAEHGALIGFAGPRVIEQTTKQKLPPGAQRPEFQLKHGMIDGIVHRRELRSTLARLLRIVTPQPCRPTAATASDNRNSEDPDARPPVLAETGDAWQAVQVARHAERPYTLDYIPLVFSEFFELRGDRLHLDDPAIVAGLALLDGRPIGVVGHQKGRTTQDRLTRRFGMARPEGYRKALRVMRLAERLGFPIVTFIDTPGADPSLEAEERGQAWAIANNLIEMVALRVPTVAVVIGEGGSGGALALGVADRLLMLENATYSVVSPEGCALILWNDASLAPEAAAAMKLTAQHLLAAGIADRIIAEPEGGAQSDYALAGETVRAAIIDALGSLDDRFGRARSLDANALIAARFERYRHIGVVLDPSATTRD